MRARCAGLSLLEVLISLAITAMLLTATTGALVASFHAYGDVVEQSSTQITTRMITQRLLSLVRTSTDHGPLTAGTGATLNGDTITSTFLEVIDARGTLVRCEYRSESQELWLIEGSGESAVEQPLIGGVTAAQFTLLRRLNDEGVYILQRASIDLTVQPDEDATLALENGPAQAIRIVTSAMPRKLE